MAQTRLVIADDESLIRMNLKETLVGLGYLVVGEAGDGVSAITLARQLQPDLFAFGSYDFVGPRAETETLTLFATEFHRVDGRYDHLLGDRGRFRAREGPPGFGREIRSRASDR